MSWLSALMERNRGAVGSIVQKAAPLAAFTPLGLLGAGGIAGAGRALQGHANIKDVLGAGAKGAAYGGAARGVAGLARGAAGAFTPSSSAAAEAGSTTLPQLAPNALSALPGATPVAVPGSSAALLSSLGMEPESRGHAALSAVRGAFNHETLPAYGQVASGVLNARENDQRNRIQQGQLDFEHQQYDEERKRKQQMAELLAPLIQQMLHRTAGGA